MPLTPAVCRAARGLLDWTQADLADAADVCRSTVRDFEKDRHGLQRASASAIVAAFEAAGVELLSDAAGPGVRLRAPRPVPADQDA
jgi:DNA-binding XRE family transcriptional regulator